MDGYRHSTVTAYEFYSIYIARLSAQIHFHVLLLLLNVWWRRLGLGLPYHRNRNLQPSNISWNNHDEQGTNQRDSRVLCGRLIFYFSGLRARMQAFGVLRSCS